MKRPIIKTHVAQAGYDDHRFRGRSLFNDLASRTSLTQLIALSVSKHQLPADGIDMLNDVAVVLTVADPHIWPLKITRIAGAYGSLFHSLTAGQVALQEGLIGPWRFYSAAEMLVELEEKLCDTLPASQAESIIRDYFNNQERPPGFGVAFRAIDERLVALESCVNQRNRNKDRFWRLLLTLKQYSEKMPLKPHISLGVAAVLLDLGYCTQDIIPLVVSLLQAAFISNAVEASREPQSVLRKLPSQFIEYVGKPNRVSPRASS